MALDKHKPRKTLAEHQAELNATVCVCRHTWRYHFDDQKRQLWPCTKCGCLMFTDRQHHPHAVVRLTPQLTSEEGR